MRIRLGIILIIAGTAALFFLLDNPSGSPALADVLTRLWCQPGERIEQASGRGESTFSFQINSRTVNYVCVHSDGGSRRDVTGEVALTIFGSFFASLLIGVLLLVQGVTAAGSRAMRRAAPMQQAGGARRMADALSYEQGISRPSDWRQTPLTLQERLTVPDKKPSRRPTDDLGQPTWQASSQFELADRLAALQEALDKKQISHSQYVRLRRQVFEKFG